MNSWQAQDNEGSYSVYVEKKATWLGLDTTWQNGLGLHKMACELRQCVFSSQAPRPVPEQDLGCNRIWFNYVNWECTSGGAITLHSD
jgi:hypothetical protein